jgi:hypothetical protein
LTIFKKEINIKKCSKKVKAILPLNSPLIKIKNLYPILFQQSNLIPPLTNSNLFHLHLKKPQLFSQIKIMFLNNLKPICKIQLYKIQKTKKSPLKNKTPKTPPIIKILLSTQTNSIYNELIKSIEKGI